MLFNSDVRMDLIRFEILKIRLEFVFENSPEIFFLSGIKITLTCYSQ